MDQERRRAPRFPFYRFRGSFGGKRRDAACRARQRHQRHRLLRGYHQSAGARNSCPPQDSYRIARLRGSRNSRLFRCASWDGIAVRRGSAEFSGSIAELAAARKLRDGGSLRPQTRSVQTAFFAFAKVCWCRSYFGSVLRTAVLRLSRGATVVRGADFVTSRADASCKLALALAFWFFA